MMRGAAWIADYPDGDNFMQLLYGPNTGQSNNACYRSPEYDKLYEQLAPAAGRRPSATSCTARWRASWKPTRAVAADRSAAIATC